MAIWFLGLVTLQIVYGAFVAGLKAGFMYNTFPKMGSEWIPQSFSTTLKTDGLISLMESGGIVQFIHRIIALVLVIFVLIIANKSRKLELGHIQRLAVSSIVGIVFLQCVLGVFTVIYAVPLLFGVIHQFVATLVLFSTVFLIFSLQKSNPSVL